MWNWVERLEERRFFAAAPNIGVSAGRVIFSHVLNQASRPQWVTVTNRGGALLSLDSITLTGDGAADFFVRRKGVPKVLAPGKSAKLRMTFRPTAADVRVAALEVASNDADTPVLKVALRGLGQRGFFEANEPSLQRILDTLQIPVNVGDSDPSTSRLDGGAGSEEIPMQLLKKAGAGPVTVTPLAVFSWEHIPIARVGWYRPRGSRAPQEVFTIPEGNGQRLLPARRGARTFDPGKNVFGLYSSWLIEPHGDVYSEDAMNTWDTSSDRKHKVRFYPYRKASGKLIPNSYVVVMEEAFNSDFQDAVLLVQNIQPFDVPAAPANLVASAISPTAIKLNWKDTSGNETGFVIERSGKKNGTYAIVGSVGAGATMFTDAAEAGRRYYYRVRAVNGTRVSGVSNRAVALTPVALTARVSSVFSVRAIGG